MRGGTNRSSELSFTEIFICKIYYSIKFGNFVLRFLSQHEIYKSFGWDNYNHEKCSLSKKNCVMLKFWSQNSIATEEKRFLKKIDSNHGKTIFFHFWLLSFFDSNHQWHCGYCRHWFRAVIKNYYCHVKVTSGPIFRNPGSS